MVTGLLSCDSLLKEKNPTQPLSLVQELSTYHITCDEQAFQRIYKNFQENTYVPITISFNGTKISARMRIRGDTSREDPKKSLKIKFDSTSFSPNETTLNFNAEYSDHTFIRQYLSSKLMQASGQICFLAEPVKLFLNGHFLGLYLKVENMDDEFLARNQLSPKNNLYKATKDGACLSVFDEVESKWEKKTNKKSDYNDLKKLIHQVNTIPHNQFYNFIQENFEYESLVNLIAVNMLLSNGSTYYHNYYLYHDLYKTGKWQVFPWDMDKTLSYYNWMPYTYHRTSSEWESDNPLIERSLLCPPMFKDIKARVKELHHSYFNTAFISPSIDQLITTLSPHIALDTTDKIQSTASWLKEVNKEKEYFDAHYQSLQSQFTQHPSSFYVERFSQPQTDDITFKWSKSTSPVNKPISYILSYGTDFLLQDSSKTIHIAAIADTFYTVKKPTDGIYYWKVTATDGTHLTDGFNTKNRVEVKSGTLLLSPITSNKRLVQKDAPYIIPNDLVINEGVELTIDPGVKIYLKQAVNIHCHGNIVASGTKENPVVFQPDNTAKNWGFIYFYAKAKKGLFSYTSFLEGIINFKETDLFLDHCFFKIDQKNLVQGEKRSGIVWGDKGKITINHSSFEGNNTGEGVVVYHVEASINYSSFSHIPDAIEYISVKKGEIKNNYVVSSPDDAIDLNHCSNVLIEGNFLLNNNDKGISIGTEQYGPSRKNIVIKNNVLVGNQIGIAIKDSSFATIYNNTLYKNKKGIYAYKKRDDYQKGGEATVYNTIISESLEGAIVFDKWSAIEASYCCTDKTSLGKSNIVGTPDFIDPKRNNFQLSKNSPCIESGKKHDAMGAYTSAPAFLTIEEVKTLAVNEKKSVTWVKVQNNYNVPVDLSLYRLLISTGTKKKKFVFPIGSSLPPLSSVYLTKNYSLFTRLHPSVNIMGDLPKQTANYVSIQITTSTGKVVHEYRAPELNQTTP